MEGEDIVFVYLDRLQEPLLGLAQLALLEIEVPQFADGARGAGIEMHGLTGGLDGPHEVAGFLEGPRTAQDTERGGRVVGFFKHLGDLFSQGFHRERLEDVGVDVRLGGLGHDLGIGLGRGHDDGHIPQVAVIPDASQEFHAGHHGHVPVHDS